MNTPFSKVEEEKDQYFRFIEECQREGVYEIDKVCVCVFLTVWLHNIPVNSDQLMKRKLLPYLLKFLFLSFSG